MHCKALPPLISVLCSVSGAHGAEVAFYSLRAPGSAYAIEQASGLHYGRLGQREGLWLVCDRNGGRSANRVFFFATATLSSAQHQGTLTADAAFELALPRGSWSAFAAAHRGAGDAVLDEVRRRVGAAPDENGSPKLDLEAVTIAPSPTQPHAPHVFVVAEEPHSAVLELVLDETHGTTRARLVAVYAYAEREGEHGTTNNDGLEGLTAADKPGDFYWAEEGTKLHRPDAHPRLYFLDPRIGRATLTEGRVAVDTRRSDELTRAVRAMRRGSMQTLNGLTTTSDGTVLAVDRNGGWILRLDPGTTRAAAWLNLYDLDGKNLRETLAGFPGARRMPYISIEGIAVQPPATIWLADDPAMPESFRASCLLRLTGLNDPGTGGPRRRHP